MSVEYITKVIEIRDVSPVQKLILFCLANYSDEEGKSFPSHLRISQITGISRSAILRNLKDLKELGYVYWEARYKEASDGERRKDKTSNLYQLFPSEGVVAEKDGGSSTERHNTKDDTKTNIILGEGEIYNIYLECTPKEFFDHSVNSFDINNRWKEIKKLARRGVISPKTGKKLDLGSKEFWKSYFTIAGNSSYYRNKLDGFMSSKCSCKTLLSLNQFNAIIERKHG